MDFIGIMSKLIGVFIHSTGDFNLKTKDPEYPNTLFEAKTQAPWGRSAIANLAKKGVIDRFDYAWLWWQQDNSRRSYWGLVDKANKIICILDQPKDPNEITVLKSKFGDKYKVIVGQPRIANNRLIYE